jgi:hypothetical protein
MPNTGIQSNRISDPYMQAVALRILNTLQIAAEKAVAHNVDSATYPISDTKDSIEQIFLAHYESETGKTKICC